MNPDLVLIINVVIVIIIIFSAVIFLADLAMKINAYSYERKRINCEIRRTTGSEQEYWKRQKRRLWLVFLPFYRR